MSSASSSPLTEVHSDTDDGAPLHTITFTQFGATHPTLLPIPDGSQVSHLRFTRIDQIHPDGRSEFLGLEPEGRTKLAYVNPSRVEHSSELGTGTGIGGGEGSERRSVEEQAEGLEDSWEAGGEEDENSEDHDDTTSSSDEPAIRPFVNEHFRDGEHIATHLVHPRRPEILKLGASLGVYTWNWGARSTRYTPGAESRIKVRPNRTRALEMYWPKSGQRKLYDLERGVEPPSINGSSNTLKVNHTAVFDGISYTIGSAR